MTERRRCPDDGACHHGCVEGCFRVACCEPLSSAFPDGWPEEIERAYIPVVHADPITQAIVATENPSRR